MKFPRTLLLTALLISTGHLQFAEVRTWTDTAGNSREAELVNAFGPMAFFRDPVNGYTPFMASELCAEDQALVEAFKAAKVSTPWQDSKSEMTKLLKGRLFTMEDGNPVNYTFGEEAEPDFYVLYFVESGDEKMDAFTAKMVGYYDQLRRNGFQNFEVILILQARSGDAQKEYMQEMGIKWPAIKWISRNWLRELMTMKGKGNHHVVILDQERHILQRTLEGRDDLQPANMLVYLNNLLSWTNPDNPLVALFRFSQLLRSHLEENPGDAPPQPYQCSLEGIDFSIIPDQSFKIKLDVMETGFARDVTVTTEMPEEARKAVLKAASGWLFIPRVKDGKYVKTTIAFPVQNKQ